MSRKDLFSEPFDEGTLTKLEIYSAYLKKWLPTFIQSSYNKPIQIYDLFAGEGYDSNKSAGSPILALDIVNEFRGSIINQKKKVILYLNEYEKDKYELLCEAISLKVQEYHLETIIDIKLTNDSFTCCITKYKSELQNGCNLIFIDQNGTKEVTESIFSFLISLDTTEFMFFISSTYLHRFAGQPEMTLHHPKFDFDRIRRSNRKHIHNIICEEYHKYVPSHVRNYLILPFSIMKNDNINVYGLIFVTKHVAGADKFLHTVWEQNALNGNANYDIEEDSKSIQEDLFLGRKLTKIEAFQKTIKEKVLQEELKNNKEIYLYTLNRGHIPIHACEAIKQMKKDSLIHYENKSPLINYNKVIKEKNILQYTLVR